MEEVTKSDFCRRGSKCGKTGRGSASPRDFAEKTLDFRFAELLAGKLTCPAGASSRTSQIRFAAGGKAHPLRRSSFSSVKRFAGLTNEWNGLQASGRQATPGRSSAQAPDLSLPPLTKARFPCCASSPHRTRFAGLRRGPRNCRMED